MKPTYRISKIWMFITLLILSFGALRVSDIYSILDPTLCGDRIVHCTPGNCEIFNWCDVTALSYIVWFVVNIILTILAYYCMIWTKFWIYKEIKGGTKNE